MDGLGTDGHPSRGGFLPPAQDRNRMWAGGRVEFRQPLKVGVPAERVSTVAEVKEKTGRTGSLLFVTVRHEYVQSGEVAILEEQDIVYRQPTPPKLTGSEPAPRAEWSDTVHPTPVLLFRYSAVTFNGHRPLWVQAQADRLASVIGHVIANAQEATQPGDSIEVSVGERDGRALGRLSGHRAGLHAAGRVRGDRRGVSRLGRVAWRGR